MKVNLSDVMMAMDAVRGDAEVFFDRDTCTFVYPVPGRKPAGDAVVLPDRQELNDYGVMEAFIASLPDGEAKEWLGNAVRGRGAFRRFRGACERFHLLDDWYGFEEDARREQAMEWCERNGIAYEETEETEEQDFDWNDETQFMPEPDEPPRIIRNPVRIIDVTRKNAPQLISLITECRRRQNGGRADADDLLEETEQFLSEGGKMAAVSDQGLMTGYIRGREENGILVIDELFVRTEDRRNGLGTKLCRRMEEEGMPLQFRAAPVWADAVRFLSALGYAKQCYTVYMAESAG